MTISAVLSAMTTVYQGILSMFSNIITTITSNPLLFVPVIFSLLGGLVVFSIGVIRRFGIHGISSTGRRRRRR